MILTHLVMFRFLRGGTSTPAPPASTGFNGYTTVGVLAYMRAFSPSDTPPVPSEQSMYPQYRRRRGR